MFQCHRLDVCGCVAPDRAARGETDAKTVDGLNGEGPVEVNGVGPGSDLANCGAEAWMLLQREEHGRLHAPGVLNSKLTTD